MGNQSSVELIRCSVGDSQGVQRRVEMVQISRLALCVHEPPFHYGSSSGFLAIEHLAGHLAHQAAISSTLEFGHRLSHNWPQLLWALGGQFGDDAL